MLVEFFNLITQYNTEIFLIVFTIFLGFELISKVPTVLHTPLMSGSNAISGIVVIGGILLIRNTTEGDYLGLAIATIGMVLAAINVVGGFVVTQRMLEMFRKKPNK